MANLLLLRLNGGGITDYEEFRRIVHPYTQSLRRAAIRLYRPAPPHPQGPNHATILSPR